VADTDFVVSYSDKVSFESTCQYSNMAESFRNELTMLVVELNEPEVLISCKNLYHMPQTGKRRKEGTWHVANSTQVSAPCDNSHDNC
jgi:hypothetical protein